MKRTLLVAGTASHVGKSTVVAGLCRQLSDRGVDVVPFKAQNMTGNCVRIPCSRTTVGEGNFNEHRELRGVGGSADTDGFDVQYSPDESIAFGEVALAQWVQATSARVRPSTDHNPVCLKPLSDGECELLVEGRSIATVTTAQYFADYWDGARDVAVAAHDRLATRHDIVVAEGAGSIAEINLHHRDLANIETARFADADVLLVADLERGGAFASVVGTLELLPRDVRERVVGIVLTKHRGGRSILEPGLTSLESRTGVPILGVCPHDDPGLPAEDDPTGSSGDVARGDRPDGDAPTRSNPSSLDRSAVSDACDRAATLVGDALDYDALSILDGADVDGR